MASLLRAVSRILPAFFLALSFCVCAALVLAFAGALPTSGFAQTLAFPGAEGFGRFASGGRGGEVYIVTNLNDTGAGSLRDAVANRNASTPRTVVFAVSGTIYLNSTLRISQGNLTIAGQTAPGDGICLARYSLNPSNATNVIIRFVRSRLGDTMLVEDDAFVCRYATDLIVDHCSFSWSVDETASAYDNTNFTMQWCFATESLRDSVHTKGAHGYGGIWGGLGASFHHNLLAHHDSRNPRFNGARTHGTDGELVDMRNNVIYNWRGNSTYGGEPTDAGLPARHNMVNNVYKNGPATSTGASRYRILDPSQNTASTGATYSLFHVAGNWTTASSTVTANNWNGGVQVISSSLYPTIRADTPFTVAPVVTQTAQNAYPLVLAYAGCRLPARDAIDTRIAGEVSAGTVTYYGSKNNYPGIIDSQTDVGGWPVLASTPAPTDTDLDGMPDAWETARGLNPNLASDRNLVDAPTGYTQLELYLNELAAPAFPIPAISAQPQAQTVNLGASFTLAVTASGPGSLTYQWYHGDDALSGATSASLSVAAATATDAGDYHVVVGNDYGSVRSSDATITLLAQPPAITGQPASLSVAVGADASFTVAASGAPPLTYQWYRGVDPVSGGTSATLTLADVTAADSGGYHAVVTNPYGSTSSDVATLAVSTSAVTRVFETNFAQDTLHAASPVVTATRTNWYIMASKLATNSNVGDDPATTGVVETRPFTLGLNAGSSAANYQAATVFAATPLSLSQVGGVLRVTATFTTSNNINLGFGLFNSGGSLPHTIHHSGTSATLLGGADGIDGGVRHWVGYRALISHGSATASIVTRLAQTTSEGSITNRTQDLVVPGSGSTSYGQPAGVSVGSVTNSTTSVTPVNDTTYTLVYQISRTDADQFTFAYELYEGAATTGSALFSASGVTTAAAALPSAVTSSFDSFAIGARTTNGSVPKIVLAALSVDHTEPSTVVAPTITEQPQGVTVNQGSAATFTVAASGSPAPTFQWRRNGDPISGATSATLELASAQPGDAGDYTCVATNSAGFAISDIATLVVRVTPLITLQPVGRTLVRGGSFTLDAAASGTPAPSFQWYRGVFAIPGATASTYTVAVATLDDAGDYTVVATNPAGTDTSEVAEVIVLTPYQSWAADNGLDPATLGAPTADPAGDGVPNLLKFALGGDPGTPGSTPLPVLVRDGAALVFGYDVKTAALADYLVVPEYSADLASWTPAVHGVDGVVVVATPLDASAERVTVTLPAASRLFARLRVSVRP